MARGGGTGRGESKGASTFKQEFERRRPRELRVKADLRFVQEGRWRVCGGGGERPGDADMMGWDRGKV